MNAFTKFLGTIVASLVLITASSGADDHYKKSLEKSLQKMRDSSIRYTKILDCRNKSKNCEGLDDSLNEANKDYPCHAAREFANYKQRLAGAIESAADDSAQKLQACLKAIDRPVHGYLMECQDSDGAAMAGGGASHAIDVPVANEGGHFNFEVYYFDSKKQIDAVLSTCAADIASLQMAVPQMKANCVARLEQQVAVLGEKKKDAEFCRNSFDKASPTVGANVDCVKKYSGSNTAKVRKEIDSIASLIAEKNKQIASQECAKSHQAEPAAVGASVNLKK